MKDLRDPDPHPDTKQLQSEARRGQGRWNSMLEGKSGTGKANTQAEVGQQPVVRREAQQEQRKEKGCVPLHTQPVPQATAVKQ